MDQPSDIYVNVEGPSGHHNKWKRERKSSENIYENKNNFHALDPNRTGPAVLGAGNVKKSCRAAAVCLALLCLLLLVGLITLVFLFIQAKSEWKMEMVLSHNNLTRERNELQISYNNLNEEHHQLQISYNNLNEEQDQLQKRFEDIVNELNDLKKSLKALQSHTWIYFSSSFYYISSSKKSWQESRDDCLQKGADLVIVSSDEEQEFTRTFKKLIWIGLTDMETEGKWKWVDGTPLTTSYWASNEPNGDLGRDEDCAEIKKHDLEKSWNDESCNLERFWICEKTKF